MQLRDPRGFLTQSLPNRGIQDCISKPTAFGARAFSTTTYNSSPEWTSKVKKFFGVLVALALVVRANKDRHGRGKLVRYLNRSALEVGKEASGVRPIAFI